MSSYCACGYWNHSTYFKTVLLVGVCRRGRRRSATRACTAKVPYELLDGVGVLDDSAGGKVKSRRRLERHIDLIMFLFSYLSTKPGPGRRFFNREKSNFFKKRLGAYMQITDSALSNAYPRITDNHGFSPCIIYIHYAGN